MSATRFINTLYNTVLLRAPDDGGLAFWKGQVENGILTAAGLIENFVHSAEAARINTLLKFYQAAFNRAADSEGLRFWLAATQQGSSLREIAGHFLGHPEMTALQLNNAQFLDTLYSNLFNRSADASGKAFWLAALDAGTSRSQVLLDFVFSNEAANASSYSNKRADAYLALSASAGAAPATEQMNAKAGTDFKALVAELTAKSGKVMDGYLAGASLFADVNSNGQQDSFEPTTTTANDGSFTLQNGVIGPLIAAGGTDISTQKAFSGLLKAAEGSAVVSPLTTLLAKLEQTTGSQSAQAQLAAKLGLPATLDLSSFDPVAEALKAGASASAIQSALKVQVVAAQVATVIDFLASASAAAAGTAVSAALDTATAALASALVKSATAVDLTNNAVLQSLFSDAASQFNVSTKLAPYLAQASQMLGASMSSFDRVATASASGLALLGDSARVQVVAINAGDELEAVIRSGGNLQAAVSSFTGSQLEAAFRQASVGLLATGVSAPATSTVFALPVIEQPTFTPTIVSTINGDTLLLTGTSSTLGTISLDPVNTVLWGSSNVTPAGMSSVLNVDASGYAGNVDVTGSALANILTGTARNDSLTGGAGADTLNGGAGDDVFVITGTAELAAANAIVDQIDGGAHTTADEIRLGAAAVTLAAADSLARITNVEKISSVANSNAISLSFNDNVTGTGLTSIDLSGDSDAAGSNTVDLSNDSTGATAIAVTGSAGADAITGNGAANVLSGGNGADSISGGAGSDTLTGDAGADTLNGDAGDDVFVINGTAELAAANAIVDLIDGGAHTTADEIRLGAAAVTLAAADSLARITNVEKISSVANSNVISLSFNDNVTGTGLTSIDLSGDSDAAGANSVDLSNDTTGATAIAVTGSAGADTITGNGAANALSGGAGDDVFVITGTAELAAANAIVDLIDGGTANDEIRLGAAAVTLAAADSLARITNVEKISSVANSNAISLTFNDNITGTGLTSIDLSGDSDAAGANSVDLSGDTTGATAIAVTGSAGADTITGNGAANVISGGNSADTLTGGAGADTLNGDAGDDVFVITGTAELAAANAIVDLIDGGAHTVADEIRLGAAAVTLAVTDSLARITNVEKISSVANSNAISLSFNDNVTGTGLASIDLSGDSDAAGANVVDLSGDSTGATAIAVTGSAGADAITGNGAANTLSGGNGADTLTGGAGADTLNGDAGDDVFVITGTAELAAANAIVDLIDGGAHTAADEIRLGAAAVTLAAADSLARITNVEKISSVANANAISLTFNDNVTGTGLASIDLSGDSDAAGANSVDLSNDSTGATAIAVTGSAGADAIIGNGAANVISGGNGADTLTGGAGADTLNGDAGDDVFVITGTAELVAANAIVDLIDGGAHTAADEIRLGAAAVTLAAADSLARITNVEKISSVANSNAISLSFNDNVTGTGLTSIDLSGDSDAAGANVVDLSNDTTGATAIAVTGSAGADTITGNGAANVLTGGTGADTLNGGAGDDVFVITGTAELVAANAIVDLIDGGAHTTADEIRLGAAALTLAAADSLARITNVEKISALANANAISLSFNDDVTGTGLTSIDLSGDSDAAGANTVDLSGDTTGATSIAVTGSAGADAITGNGAANTLTGGAGADTLNGGAGDDVFVITGTAELVAANAIVDLIDGGAHTAADEIRLGAAAVTLAAADSLARITNVEKISSVANSNAISLSFNDNVTGTGLTNIDLSGDSDAAGANSVDLSGDTTGATAIAVTGSAGADTITGNGAANALSGGNGADSISGGAGGDTLTGEAGADTLNGDAGDDVFVITGTAELVAANAIVDLIDGGAHTAADEIRLGAAAVTLAAADSLARITNIEKISSVANSNAISLSFNDDVTGTGLTSIDLSGDSDAAGANSVDLSNDTTGATAIAVTGSAGADTITGNGAANALSGGAGADTINGGNGADTYTGGTGNDTLTLTEATAAADTVVHGGAADGADSITDFAFGAGADLFDFTANLLNGTTTATSNLSALSPVSVLDNGVASANDVLFTFTGAGDEMAAGSTAANAVANAVTALTSTLDFSTINIDTGDSLLLLLDDGTNSFLFQYLADATAGTTSAADLTLIGIFNGVQTGTLATGDLI